MNALVVLLALGTLGTSVIAPRTPRTPAQQTAHSSLPSDLTPWTKASLTADYYDYNAPVVHAFRTDPEQKGTTVTISEHHNEVLYHRFGFANAGLLPKTGVTVIHVDSHSDFMFPSLLLGGTPPYPSALVQATNIASFIPAAGEMGLIKHVIWLRKNWPGFEQAWNYPQEFGSWIIKVGADKYQKFCFYKNPRVDLDPPYCGMDARPLFQVLFTVAELNENTFEKLDKTYRKDFPEFQNWRRSPTILDIDFDYFSTNCASATDIMERTGLSMEKYLQIQRPLFNIDTHACPSSIEELRKMRKDLSKLAQHKSKPSVREVEQALHSAGPEFWCDDEAEEESEEDGTVNLGAWGDPLGNHAKLLLKMKEKFLQALDVLYTLKPGQRLHVADLMDTEVPQSGRMLFETMKPEPAHRASLPELVQSFRDLRLALTSPKAPHISLVTLCRSITDGYTPLQLWSEIEWGTISALQQSLGSLSVHWDRTLAPPRRPEGCSADIRKPCTWHAARQS